MFYAAILLWTLFTYSDDDFEPEKSIVCLMISWEAVVFVLLGCFGALVHRPVDTSGMAMVDSTALC